MPASVALRGTWIPLARPARGRRPRSSDLARAGKTPGPPRAPVIACQRRRSHGSTDRRVVGRGSAADGRQDRSQLRLVAPYLALSRSCCRHGRRAIAPFWEPRRWTALTSSSSSRQGGAPWWRATQPARRHCCERGWLCGAGPRSRISATKRLPRARSGDWRSCGLGALEERIDADLRLGRHAELVAELEHLVGEHPLRERLRGQLMLALCTLGPPGGGARDLSGRATCARERARARAGARAAGARARDPCAGRVARSAGSSSEEPSGRHPCAPRGRPDHDRRVRAARVCHRRGGTRNARRIGRAHERPAQLPGQDRSRDEPGDGPDSCRRTAGGCGLGVRVALGREPRRCNRCSRRCDTWQDRPNDLDRSSADRTRRRSRRCLGCRPRWGRATYRSTFRSRRRSHPHLQARQSARRGARRGCGRRRQRRRLGCDGRQQRDAGISIGSIRIPTRS